MKTVFERLHNGIIKENPTFVLMLGMCPTLAVTSSAVNGLGMGLATTAVLVMSNLMISLLRKVIPNGIRMPAYIVIVASFVTIVQMLLHAYVTSLYDSLGIYIPLIPSPAVSLFDKTEKPVIVSLSVDMPTAVLISPP